MRVLLVLSAEAPRREALGSASHVDNDIRRQEGCSTLVPPALTICIDSYDCGWLKILRDSRGEA